eukprot:752791-Hanusia_phi.AAC.3
MLVANRLRLVLRGGGGATMAGGRAGRGGGRGEEGRPAAGAGDTLRSMATTRERKVGAATAFGGNTAGAAGWQRGLPYNLRADLLPGPLLQHDPCLGARAFSKKAKKGKQAEEEEEEVEEVDISHLVEEMEEGLNSIIESYDKELAVIKTGRADPRILDKVRVKAYDDAEVQLATVAQVSAPDPRTLLVNVFDPNIVGMVDKAIRGAGLDLNPTVRRREEVRSWPGMGGGWG